MTKEEMIRYAQTQLPDAATYPKDVFYVDVPVDGQQTPVRITFKKYYYYPEHSLSCKVSWKPQ